MSNTYSRTTPIDALEIFGLTGDLAYKILFPALYAMVKRGALSVPVAGVAAPKWNWVPASGLIGRAPASARGFNRIAL